MAFYTHYATVGKFTVENGVPRTGEDVKTNVLQM